MTLESKLNVLFYYLFFNYWREHSITVISRILHHPEHASLMSCVDPHMCKCVTYARLGIKIVGGAKHEAC